MPSSESREHKELRTAIRALVRHFDDLETHQFDYSHLKTHRVNVLPMGLDNSNAGPSFFNPCSASLLDPNDEYDRERSKYSGFNSIDPVYRCPINCARGVISYFSYYVFANEIHCGYDIHSKLWSSIRDNDKWASTNLFEHKFPEYGAPKAIEAKDRSYPHVKAMIYSNLNGEDGQILRGEIVVVLRIIRAQVRRVLLFSFIGPQHARVIEAYFDGSSLVMRPTKLFDLREKDEALIKFLGQWYIGEATGDTKVLGSGDPDPLQT
ncbi:uncharacterized protein TRUGW13939_00591 [Talaromyces rugulosus]|uniref:Fungal-type protein kinase domain-containing protein n=1 Tax=Talaromyces rugulosus TaxID=121627 RepID=A0A7H8QIP1_TALRU|nr:uncharacterized protein TRUGW13939_00591 [Talaromyces rugulosus]QKX53512.1 hypothetical protein TRUGW13939_00591 [Talaromyces rugulosus]